LISGVPRFYAGGLGAKRVRNAGPRGVAPLRGADEATPIPPGARGEDHLTAGLPKRHR